MARSVVQYDVPVVVAGISFVTVHVYFEIDPATCLVEYQSYSVSGLDDLTIDAFGLSTGVSVSVNVMPTSPVVIPCEAGGCRKEVTITISVTKSISILGGRFSRAPYTVTSVFRTSCLPQCCEGGADQPLVDDTGSTPKPKPKEPVEPPPPPPPQPG